jgi:hypothetical protein
MDCAKAEERLSEYMESSLPARDMEEVAEHLGICSRCSALLEEMRSVVSLCRHFPTLEMDLDLLERILLRTSGRPRRRSFRESLQKYLVRPLLTPRFAAGVGLAAVFLFLMGELLAPRMPAVLSTLSPAEVFRLMDRGIQHLYGEGLKAYDKKNEWQAQINYFRNSMVNKLRFMIEQIDAPMEGKKKPGEPAEPNEQAPKGKSSSLRMSPDRREIDSPIAQDFVTLGCVGGIYRIRAPRAFPARMVGPHFSQDPVAEPAAELPRETRIGRGEWS